MNKQAKILLGVAGLIIALGAVLFVAEPEEGETKKAPEVVNILEVDKTNHDFGTISMKDGKVKTVYTITNPKEAEVTLRTLYTSCMCTQATLRVNGTTEGPFDMQGHGLAGTFNQKLQPGQTAEIEVEFDPNAHGPSGVGVIERVVILEGLDGKLLTVGLRANVTP
jgi:hypothetical protein